MAYRALSGLTSPKVTPGPLTRISLGLAPVLVTVGLGLHYLVGSLTSREAFCLST